MRRPRTRSLALLATGLLLLLAGCAKPVVPGPDAAPSAEEQAITQALHEAQTMPDQHHSHRPGQLFAVADHGLALLDSDGFAALAAGADYVLLGETHTSALDHRVQAELIELVARDGRKPVIGLEMADAPRQPGLDKYNRLEISLTELPQALDWENTWRHPFELYAPVFRTVRRLMLPLYGLNVPPHVVRAFSSLWPDSREKMDPADAAHLPDEIIPPSDEQKEYLSREMEGHMAMAEKSGKAGFMAERFYTVQALWDTKMAQEAVRLRKELGRPVIIVVGAGHVEKGWGVAMRIARFDPGARILSVVPWSGPSAEYPLPDPDAADVFFFSPPAHTSRLGYTVEQTTGGALVTMVAEGSKADLAGFMPGDVITGIQGMKVDSLPVLHMAALQARSDGKALEYEVLRDGEQLTLTIAITAARMIRPRSE